MAQPIVKYTLTKKGTIPEWLSTDARAFAGEHGITGNKSGKIPRYEAPQDTIFLGIAAGDPDPDGTPDDYVGTFANKAALQTYITETGSTLQYKTTTLTATGIQTTKVVGLATVWETADEDYQGGLTTTTTPKFTQSGVGTAVGVTTTTTTSRSTTTTDGVSTFTDTTVETTTTEFETSYDYAAEATRLWDIYEAINS